MDRTALMVSPRETCNISQKLNHIHGKVLPDFSNEIEGEKHRARGKAIRAIDLEN